VRAWVVSRPGIASSWWRRVAIRTRPGSWGCRSSPVIDGSITANAPASSPAHIHAAFTAFDADGKWIKHAPCLASRNRSSMLVRRRNHASNPTSSPRLAGMLVTMKLTAPTWSSWPPRAKVSWSSGMVRRRRARGSVLMSLAAIVTRRTIV